MANEKKSPEQNFTRHKQGRCIKPLVQFPKLVNGSRYNRIAYKNTEILVLLLCRRIQLSIKAQPVMIKQKHESSLLDLRIRKRKRKLWESWHKYQWIVRYNNTTRHLWKSVNAKDWEVRIIYGRTNQFMTRFIVWKNWYRDKWPFSAACYRTVFSLDRFIWPL